MHFSELTSLLQDGEDCDQLLVVSCRVGAGGEDVLQVDNGDMQTTQKRIHEVLKSHVGIAQTKSHADKLQKAERCDNHGDEDLMVAFAQVQLAKNGAAIYVGCQIRHVQ
jgi:hypothetical protein